MARYIGENSETVGIYLYSQINEYMKVMSDEELCLAKVEVIHCLLARLDQVQEELLYYPGRRRWRRRRH